LSKSFGRSLDEIIALMMLNDLINERIQNWNLHLRIGENKKDIEQETLVM
jgi:hypothetical protein